MLNEFSPEWRSLMASAKSNDDLTVPEDYFNQSAHALEVLSKRSDHQEFDVPPGYFDFHEELVMSGISAQQEELFFQQQQEKILSGVRLEGLRNDNEFVVPSAYFDQSAAEITTKARSQQGKVISMRSRFMWFSLAAAAVIALVIFIVLPESRNASEQSFASLLEQADVDIDDLEYFASEDDVYELYFAFETAAVADTIVADSSASVKSALDLPAQDAGLNSSAQLDPRTGLPLKKQTDAVKPSGKNGIPSWDDISNEELLEYLLDEGDEDLINDL